MNEVTKIHLGRQPFSISVSAHKALRDYLDAISKQVNDKDVVEEVELRMAELLTERGVKGEKVILVKDVDFLKAHLGNPRDFKEDADGEDTTPEPSGKRLYRDTDNAMIAGVASGLSNYFGLDVLIIRILFVIATIITVGWGVLVYIVLWLLVPEAKTSSDRLMMAGKSVTVDSLKEIVDRADVKGAARRANNSIAGPINTFFNFILKVVGVVFIISGLSALFGLIVAGSYILLHNGRFLQDNIFPVGFREHLLLYVGMGVAALISVFIILFGIAIFRRKWPIGAWITGILIGLIFIGLATGGALVADTVPNVRDRYNANVHTTVRTLKPFTAVNIAGKVSDINFQISDKYYVGFNYYDHPDLGSIKTNVKDGTLLIDSSQFNENRNCQTLCIPDTYNMVITVYSPNPIPVTNPDKPFPVTIPDKPVYP